MSSTEPSYSEWKAKILGIHEDDQVQARQAEKLRDAIIADRTAKDPACRELAGQMARARHVLHRHRLKLGRKKFGMKCQEKRLGETRLALVDAETVEITMARRLCDCRSRGRW